jgi:hypothetical protein
MNGGSELQLPFALENCESKWIKKVFQNGGTKRKSGTKWKNADSVAL